MSREKEFPAYPYIRDEVRRGGLGLSEHELRLMLKRGELPGFYVGKDRKFFRINHAKLVELLNSRSVRAGQESEA